MYLRGVSSHGVILGLSVGLNFPIGLGACVVGGGLEMGVLRCTAVCQTAVTPPPRVGCVVPRCPHVYRSIYVYVCLHVYPSMSRSSMPIRSSLSSCPFISVRSCASLYVLEH